MDPLSLEIQGRLRKDRRDDPDIQLLLKECKRLRTRYVGTELHYLNPIAERCGRRIKILVNHLNEDAAHIAVDQGIQEMTDELTKWSRMQVEDIPLLPYRLRVALSQSGFEVVSDVIRASESELMDLPGVRYRDIVRLEASLARIGCKR